MTIRWLSARVPQVGATLFVALATVGCAAPGSRLTRVALNARLTRADGTPLANEKVELCLPARYGLAGLDARYNPAIFGHKDQRVTATTSGTGEVRHVFDPVTYSLVVFFIPPGLVLPLRPPKPLFVLTLIDRPECRYVVGASKKRLEWRTRCAPGRSAPERALFIDGVSGGYSLRKLTGEDGRALRGWAADLTITFAEKDVAPEPAAAAP